MQIVTEAYISLAEEQEVMAVSAGHDLVEVVTSQGPPERRENEIPMVACGGEEEQRCEGRSAFNVGIGSSRRNTMGTIRRVVEVRR